uniref:Uncharacterized protein n=1 Tax=Rhizophora mucronata TaxID=61149 RepID=A0A2P2PYG2_RHIMU
MYIICLQSQVLGHSCGFSQIT